MNKNFKKLNVLTLTLFISFVAGCTSGNQGSDDNEPATEITFLSSGDRLEGEELSDDLVVKYIENKFNVKFKFINEPSPTDSEVYTKLNMYMASDEVPDVMVMRTDNTLAYTCYEDLVDANYLVNVKDYVNERSESFPKLSEIVNASDIGSFNASDGNLYIIPRRYAYDHAFVYRKDWLDELGLSMPTNETEFKNVLQAFVDNDPDGKGTTGLAMAYGFWFEHIFAGFTGAHRCYEQDGQLRSVWDPDGERADQMMDALQYCIDLYQGGLLYQDMFTAVQRRDEYALFEAGRAGVLLTGIGGMKTIYEKLVENFPDAEICYGLWNGPAGIARVQGGSNYYLGTAINAKSGKVDKIMEILEYFLSDEGETLLTKGIEGVHYTKDGDTIIPNLDAEGIDYFLTPTKHSLRGWVTGTFVFDEFTDTEVWTNGMKEFYDEYCLNSNAPYDPADGYYALLPKRYQAQIGNKPEIAIQKWEGYFMTGKADGKSITLNKTTFAQCWSDLKANKEDTLIKEYSKLILGK